MHKTISLNKVIALLTFFLITVHLTLGNPKKSKEKYLFKLGDKEYYEDEFRYYFFKNNNNLSKDSVRYKVEEYLELYIKFRLKVQEALALKRDKDPEFTKEFNGYKSQLAQPYLMESKITESLVLETYERMKEERSASHILLKVSKDALPEDTLKVYNRLLDLKKKIGKGENFDTLAFQYSEDPSAKSNYGNLGFFSAMQMVYPFEEATFKTPVGQLAGPIRTQFGYHLIHVKDKRPAIGKIQVAHIMIRSKDDSLTDPALKKAQSIYEKLQTGEDWDTLCKLHSEDFNTSKKGGALNWFGTGNIVKEFEDAAFSLDTIGSISKPVRTQFGWHIIKLLGKKGLEPFEKIKPQLENTLSRDARSQVKKEKAIAAIKSQHSFTLNQNNKKLAFAKLDSSLLKGKWHYDSLSTENKLILFTLKGEATPVGDFLKYVNDHQRKRTETNLLSYVTELYNRFEEKSIFDFEEEHLAKTNFDYKMILEEYRSGILLFSLMEEMVWEKAVKDSIGQKMFYENNKEKYHIKENAEVRFFSSEKEEVITKAKTFLDKTKKEIDSAFNVNEPLTLQLSERVVEKGEDKLVDMFWTEGVHKHAENGRYYLIYVKKINPEGVKPFENTRGMVISGYQDKLESDWIKELKSKYPVKVNKGILKKIISKIEKEV
ncbi:peptidylprolyl isomerase [Reichenbachiella sp. MALMAid0571]|uniref:peptidylprolyl isomerase n=1 Tax=Reichenbachiella sp. MALMAid0571 TaxID=3143939 RepID=UPI0032DF4032